MKAGDNICEQIVALIREGKNKEAADIIMSLCYDNLFGTQRRKYPDTQVFPDSMIRSAILGGVVELIRAIKEDRFQCLNDNSPCAYIAKVAYSTLSKYWAKEKKSPLVPSPEKTSDKPIKPLEGEKIDAKTILNEASERCKEIIILRIYDRLSFPDIGRELEITEANARVSYHQCIRKLRKIFRKDIEEFNK